MSRGSAYRALIVSIEPDGRDARDNARFLVRWRSALDDTEAQARTRGYIADDLARLNPGDRANLIRDGRGSIIALDRA